MVADRRLLQREAFHDVAHTQRRFLGGDQPVDFQAHRLAQSTQHSYERISRTRGERLDVHGGYAALGWSFRRDHGPIVHARIEGCQFIDGR